MPVGVAEQKCCPTPPSGETYAYVDSNGYFFNIFTNTIMKMTGWSGGLVEDIYGKCVLHQAFPAAYGIPANPVDCPCCPAGYTYIQNYGCAQRFNLKDRTESVPCINCVCEEPPTPPECPECTQSIPHVTLIMNTTTKNCTDCNPSDGELPEGKIQGFVAINLLNPIVNFKLK